MMCQSHIWRNKQINTKDKTNESSKRVSLNNLLIDLKVHECRSENLLTFSTLRKNNVPEVTHYNTFYFLRYTRLRYLQCLFINIRKQ